MFPQVIVMATGFDRAMWRNVACMIGVEGRSIYNVGNGGFTYWAPNVNVWRDPRWGRGQETPGEDPRVIGEFAVEYVMGLEWNEITFLCVWLGFSAMPLTLYVPPVRTLTLFMEAMEELVRETEVFVHGRYCWQLWVTAVRMLSCVLPS
ncbi:hypothetical protein Droror1_Dr00011751 [Drosera rotundifolia]